MPRTERERSRGSAARRRVFRLQSFSKAQAKVDVDDELEHHLFLCCQELIEQGWSEIEAREEALRRFGDLDFTKEYCARESSQALLQERRTMWLDDLRADVKVGMRTLWRSPTYAFVVVATLAIGIAANTTIFSLMNPYLFRTLPFAEPQELVQVGGFSSKEQYDGGRFSADQVEDLSRRVEDLAQLGYYYYGTKNLTDGQAAERVNVSTVSGNLLPLLGTPPIMGRVLQPRDVTAGDAKVAVIGEAMWVDRFGSDPNILESSLRLDGEAYEIVGVMPRRFTFPFGGLEIWVPSKDDVVTERSGMSGIPVARLKPRASAEQLEDELNAAIVDLGAIYPDLDGRYSSVSLTPLREALNFAWDVVRVGFFLLLGAVVFVLVMACLNVASITLARTRSRSREVAIRAAVGAHRQRLVRQLLTESFLLAVVGGVLGVSLAFFATKMLNGLVPDELFRVGDVTVDGRVLLFSAGITLATPFLFGLAPAWTSVGRSMVTSLRSGGSAGVDRRTVRGRKALVVVEIALAIVLVTGTGLMIRSLQAVSNVDLGFQAERILASPVSPERGRYAGVEEIDAYFAAAKARLLALPGVDSVATASHIPLNHETIGLRFQAGDGLGEPYENWPSSFTSRVDGDYFATMGIPILSGRSFASSDSADQQAIVISRKVAENLFPDGDAVGREVRYGAESSLRSGTVVGVVDEVRFQDLTSAERPHIYRPLEGSSSRRRFLLANSSGDEVTVLRSIGPALAEVDPAIPARTQRYSEIVRESTLLWAMSSVFLGVFGLIAVLLAALGIYGLMAYLVAQRRQEMGLRIALGAESGAIQRSILFDALKLSAVGLGAGLVLALVGANAARSLLYGVSAVDPVTLIGVMLLFAAVATLAAVVPARRASRLNPLQVLRTE